MDSINNAIMEVKINISPEQMEKAFTHYGFEIVEGNNSQFEHLHGSRFIETNQKYKFVKNPMNGELILLADAFKKLLNAYVQSILFSFNKIEVMQSLES